MFCGYRDTVGMRLEELSLELDNAQFQRIIGCSLERHGHVRARNAAATLLPVHGLAQLLKRGLQNAVSILKLSDARNICGDVMRSRAGF